MTPHDWHAIAMEIAWFADRGVWIERAAKRRKLTHAAWLEIAATLHPGGIGLPRHVMWHSAGWLCVQAGLYAEGEACVRQALAHGAQPAYVDELLTAALRGGR